MFIISPWFLVPYLTFNFILALLLYNYGKKFFYAQDARTYQDDHHNKYKEFRRYEDLSFWRIFFGLTFLFWVRIISTITLSMGLWICLKIAFFNEESKNVTQTKRKAIVLLTKFFHVVVMFIMGLRFKDKRYKFETIYKKYLGPDYEAKFNAPFSAMISNHISWAEILYFISKYSSGFIAKSTVLNVPFIGFIAEKLECLFIDRTNVENRQLVVKKF